MKRILLIVDVHLQQPELLDLAVQMASALHAELLVSYLQDENLMRSASLPFTKEVMLITSQKRSLTQTEVGFSYRARSSLLSSRIDRVARVQGVSWSVTMIQQNYAQHVAAISEATDLVIMGIRNFALTRSINASVLIAGAGASTPAYIACIYPADNTDTVLIHSALGLAHFYHIPLYMLVVATTEQQVTLVRQDSRHLGFDAQKTLWRGLKNVSYPEIGRSLRWERGGLLLYRGRNMLTEQDVRHLVEDLEMKIMIHGGQG